MQPVASSVILGRVKGCIDVDIRMLCPSLGSILAFIQQSSMKDVEDDGKVQ